MQATRHMNLNSGLFFTRANERTRGLMDRIASRLAKEAAWDQSVFNEEIFFLSHDDYVSPNISVRVMNFHKVSQLCRNCCVWQFYVGFVPMPKAWLMCTGAFRISHLTVMHVLAQFMNSKVLFKTVRHMPRSSQPKPVSIHINYHPGTSRFILRVNRWVAKQPMLMSWHTYRPPVI